MSANGNGEAKRGSFASVWSWVLKITGWGTFVVGGVIVPLARHGRVEFGTLIVGTVLAIAGSSDRLLDVLSRRLPDSRPE
jgi:hypothetical protein